MKKTCEICGKEFETNLPNKKYCSPECRMRAFDETQRRYRIKAGILRPEKEIKECAYCGKAFTSRGSQHRFCSRKCQRASTRAQPRVLKCAFCGKEFVAQASRHKYCSSKCKELANSKRFRFGLEEGHKLLICEGCGKEFRQITGNQRYCSIHCRKTANRLKWEAERRKSIAEKTFKRVCVYCGKEFETNDSRKIYCSQTCNVQAVLEGSRARDWQKKQATEKRQSQLNQRIREADELGLSYGNYVAKLRMGATFEELKEKLRNEKSVDGDSDSAF